MATTVLQVHDLSKQYRLGTLGTGSLRRDLQVWLRKKTGRKEGGSDTSYPDTIREPAYLWALQGVSFEVKQGEAWGIVGRNGAGKSTLLKILSRIVKPTGGFVRGRGKVSSLLEVGTGFHQDLTGRENIFICGHILGMNKAEIKKRFEAIVDFSGVGALLDTPVKRYSSGQYVRLAFAVAAHLEPDILIVDEVLAVGDAEFQRKCLGRMKDAATLQGRTVLFVSHNMQAVNNLCTHGLWLDQGKVKASGAAKEVVGKYLGSVQQKRWKQHFSSPEEAPGNEHIRMLGVELKPQLTSPWVPVDIRTPLRVEFSFHNASDDVVLAAGVHLFTLNGECIFDVSHTPAPFRKGLVSGYCEIPGNFLNDGAYYLSLIIVRDSSEVLFYWEECLHFEVEDFRENLNWYGKWMGYVRPKFPVVLTQEQVAEVTRA